MLPVLKDLPFVFAYVRVLGAKLQQLKLHPPPVVLSNRWGCIYYVGSVPLLPLRLPSKQ